jgi:hypothetical protein
MKNILRWLLVIEWLLIFAAIGIGIWAVESLPVELRQWLEFEDSDLTTTTLVISCVILVGLIVGTIGLFLTKRWGFWVYLASTLLATFSNWSPVVQHPVEAILAELSLLVSGAVIGLGFRWALGREPGESDEPPLLAQPPRDP